METVPNNNAVNAYATLAAAFFVFGAVPEAVIGDKRGAEHDHNAGCNPKTSAVHPRQFLDGNNNQRRYQYACPSSIPHNYQPLQSLNEHQL